MREIKIEGKTYKLKGRFGQVEKLLNKYDVLNLGEWDAENKYSDFLLESVWRLIVPKWGIKPFLFFYRFKKQLDIEELKECIPDVFKIIYGLSGVDEKETDEKTEIKKSSEENEVIKKDVKKNI